MSPRCCKSAPLIITALSVLLYGEVVGWRRWVAIGIGFAGALLVIKPIPSEFDIWAVVGAASAFAAAIREIQTRHIGGAVPVLLVAFWGTVAITLCGAAFIVGEDWRLLGAGELFQLFVAAAFVGIAIFLLALGFRDVDLSVVAPFRYSLPAHLRARRFPGVSRGARRLDRGRAPALIVGSGIYTLHREAVRRRSLTGTAAPAA